MTQTLTQRITKLTEETELNSQFFATVVHGGEDEIVQIGSAQVPSLSNFFKQQGNRITQEMQDVTNAKVSAETARDEAEAYRLAASNDAAAAAQSATQAASGGIQDITVGNGLIKSGTSAVSLAVDIGDTAGKIVQIGSDGKLPSLDAEKLTNLSAANIPSLGSLATLNDIDGQDIAGTVGNLPTSRIDGNFPISRITGNLASAVISTSSHANSTRTTLSSVGSYTMWTVYHNKQSSTSKLLVWVNLVGHGDNGSAADLSIGFIQTAGIKHYCLVPNQSRSYSNNLVGNSSFSTSSTGNVSISVGWSTANGQNGKPFNVWNPSGSDYSRYTQSISSIIVLEVV